MKEDGEEEKEERGERMNERAWMRGGAFVYIYIHFCTLIHIRLLRQALHIHLLRTVKQNCLLQAIFTVVDIMDRGHDFRYVRL